MAGKQLILPIVFFALGAQLCAGVRDQDQDVLALRGSGKTVYVMLQLDTVNNRGALTDKGKMSWMFDKLRDARADGFMVDVWWGLTEPEPKVYNFDAYKELVEMAEQRGLKIQFVASFHTCGGNVNDVCDIPLPAFVYENSDIWYRDQEGRENKEYISLFADNVQLKDGRTPVEMYGQWFAALAEAFADKLGNTITEVQVGLGPAGELRYPAYSFANGWEFCGIGAFQSFDKHALGSLAAAGQSKGFTGPPTDAGSYNSKPWETRFFNDGYKSAYGEFFLEWYSGALRDHGVRVLQKARAAFADRVELAGKVAGIHWWYGHPSHAAELTAGYYNTNRQNAYAQIAEAFRPTGAALDFTCLEMRNEAAPSECQAKPQDLVAQVAEAACSKGVTFNGENALPRYDEAAYHQIQKWNRYLHAFTYLRLSDELMGSGFHNFKNFVGSVHAFNPDHNAVCGGS
jgi:beta-amylase